MVLEQPRDIKEELLTLAGVCQFHWVDASSREDVAVPWRMLWKEVSPVKKKHSFSLSLSVFLSNTIYSSLFTLCICLAWAFRPVSAMVHTKQVELRLKYCQPSRREKPLTDTASGMAAYTLKWHYSLSLFFSITLSLCFFLFLFSPIRHQSSLATKLGTGLGVGCISYS